MPLVITTPYRQLPICPGHSVGSPSEGTFATCSTDGPQEIASGIENFETFDDRFGTSSVVQTAFFGMANHHVFDDRFGGEGTDPQPALFGMENDAGNSSPLGTP